VISSDLIKVFSDSGKTFSKRVGEMLSFSKGRPFAVLVPKYEGGEKKLYIHDGMDDIDKRLLKGLTREEKKELKEAVVEGEPEFLSPKLLKIWKEMIQTKGTPST